MTVKFKFCLWKIQGKILEVREKSGKSQGISLWKMAENPANLFSGLFLARKVRKEYVFGRLA